MKFITKFALLSIALILFFMFYNHGEYIQLLPLKATYALNDYQSLIVFLAVLIILNIFVKPILKLFAMPLTCITLGLFSFVINFIIVVIADKMVDSFQFVNWKYAFIFSIIFSLAGSLIDFFLKDND